MCDQDTNLLHETAQALEEMARDIEWLAREVSYYREDIRRTLAANHSRMIGQINYMKAQIARLESTQLALLEPDKKPAEEMTIEELEAERPFPMIPVNRNGLVDWE